MFSASCSSHQASRQPSSRPAHVCAVSTIRDTPRCVTCAHTTVPVARGTAIPSQWLETSAWRGLLSRLATPRSPLHPRCWSRSSGRPTPPRHPAATVPYSCGAIARTRGAGYCCCSCGPQTTRCRLTRWRQSQLWRRLSRETVASRCRRAGHPAAACVSASRSSASADRTPWPLPWQVGPYAAHGRTQTGPW